MSEKWLFIRFRALGDVIMCQWPITAVHDARPQDELWLATETGFGVGVQHPGLIHQMVEFPRGRWKKNRWSPKTWAEQVRFYTALREHRFDYGVDFQGHSKTALLLRLSGARRRVQFPGSDFLSQRLNPQVPSSRPHKVEQYMDLIARLGDFECPTLPLMKALRRPEDAPTQPFVTINTGASSAEKLIDPAQLLAVFSHFQSRGVPVVWLGGPNDPAPPTAEGLDLVGKTPLESCYSWIAASALHVSADTGTAHAAAAYGTPFVTIFQSTRNAPERFRPYSPRGAVLVRPEHEVAIAAANDWFMKSGS